MRTKSKLFDKPGIKSKHTKWCYKCQFGTMTTYAPRCVFCEKMPDEPPTHYRGLYK